MLQDLGASKLADVIYVPDFAAVHPAYGAIRDAFAERGLSLLEPAEFLDTELKQGTFHNRQFEISGLTKIIESMQKETKRSSVDGVTGSVRETRVLETQVAFYKPNLLLVGNLGAIVTIAAWMCFMVVSRGA